jgi:hypothetical protein
MGVRTHKVLGVGIGCILAGLVPFVPGQRNGCMVAGSGSGMADHHLAGNLAEDETGLDCKKEVSKRSFKIIEPEIGCAKYHYWPC